MRFRTVVVAAVVLVLAAAAAMAGYYISEQARGEAAQQLVEREDSLAVEPDIRQKLVSDQDHDPTRYGANGTEQVEYNGTVWEPGPDNYTYYNETGELEFHRDESGEANVSYQYYVPADQVADDQLQTLTEAYGDVLMVALGLSFVVLLLFVGGFFARRLMGTGRRARGR